MAKLNLVGAALLAAAMPLATGCAPAGSGEPGAAALTPRQAETLDKQLAGKVAGEPTKCLPISAHSTSSAYRTTSCSIAADRTSFIATISRAAARGLHATAIYWSSNNMGHRPVRATFFIWSTDRAAFAVRPAFSATSSPIANRRGTRARLRPGRRRGSGLHRALRVAPSPAICAYAL